MGNPMTMSRPLSQP